MRNIIRIFTSDAKRLATNVVALVVIMGLSVIPSLYAWFNILSNWDPYGPDATTNLSVVVANCDKGVEIQGVELNVGDIIIKNLKENDTIGWAFAETEPEAVEGVNSGEYYAALVVDETFSQDIISFLGGDFENPKITYYENEKKNAIAPKITGKVKTTLQEEIDKAFVSTLAESMMELSDYVVSTEDNKNLSSSVIEKLETMNSDINTYITIVDSYIGIIDSANGLIDTTKMVTNQLDDMMVAGRNVANQADLAADATTGTVSTVSDVFTRNLDDVSNKLQKTSDALDNFLAKVQKSSDAIEDQVETLLLAVDLADKGFDMAVKEVRGKFPDTGIDQDIEAVETNFDALRMDLASLAEAAGATSKDTTDIAERIRIDMDNCISAVENLRTEYANTVEPQLNATMNTIQQSIAEVQRILNYSSDSITDVSNALSSYPSMMAFGKDKLVASRDAAMEMRDKLQIVIDKLSSKEENQQYSTMVSLIESDPGIIAEFISNPVKLDQRPVYEIENNGSAAAPFYIILSIWFGALILVAIIHTGLKTNPGCKNLRNYQQFFGRYMVFYLIGQLQTVITILGCLLYVDIQCKHPFLLWVAASFTSFTFTLFMYSLSYAFGNVGEALAVVLMVIQVAGSGGTFPVEVLPKVFQIMYRYMPFAYGMNALRECVGGMHANDYWKYLAGMLSYIGVALFFGLVLSIPCKLLNEMIEESKEKTDLLK